MIHPECRTTNSKSLYDDRSSEKSVRRNSRAWIQKSIAPPVAAAADPSCCSAGRRSDGDQDAVGAGIGTVVAKQADDDDDATTTTTAQAKAVRTWNSSCNAPKATYQANRSSAAVAVRDVVVVAVVGKNIFFAVVVVVVVVVVGRGAVVVVVVVVALCVSCCNSREGIFARPVASLLSRPRRTSCVASEKTEGRRYVRSALRGRKRATIDDCDRGNEATSDAASVGGGFRAVLVLLGVETSALEVGSGPILHSERYRTV